MGWPQCRGRRQPRGPQRAETAAEAEAGEERRDDQGDRHDAHAGVQHQQALPDHLVDEGRRAAQDEQRRDAAAGCQRARSQVTSARRASHGASGWARRSTRRAARSRLRGSRHTFWKPPLSRYAKPA